MDITQFDALIHPDFLQRARTYQTRHPVQKQLHTLWQKRFDEIAVHPNTALMYFSPYNPYEFSGKTIPKNRALFQEEIQRIAALHELLKDRFVRFNSNDFPRALDLKERFQTQEISFDPVVAKLRAYGEIFEACVTGPESWGKRLEAELGISKNNYIPDRELSLTHEQVRAIEAWHQTPEGNAGIPLNKA